MTKPSGGARRIPPATAANVSPALKEPDSARRPQRHILRTVAVVFATVGAVFLTKYAFDIFLIVALFACLAVVLHVGSRVITETELLSPAWIVITLLIVATGVWLVTPPDTLEKALHFERFMPRPVGAFLEWSEERGWAQRALVPPGPGGAAGSGAVAAPSSSGAARSVASQATTTAPSSASRSRGITVTVVTGQSTVRAGQAVVITAMLTFPGPLGGNASRTVRFLDGGLPIGTAPLDVSGITGTASLTTSALLLGTHTISASYAGPGLLFGTVRSRPVTVTVTQ